MTALVRFLALAWTCLLLAWATLAMTQGGSLTVNFNALHEGWAEVGLLAVLIAGQVYVWVRGL